MLLATRTKEWQESMEELKSYKEENGVEKMKKYIKVRYFSLFLFLIFQQGTAIYQLLFLFFSFSIEFLPDLKGS